MIGKTLGHYRILSPLGEGGMGVVYRARDQRLERDVAIKVLPPGTLADENARRRFRREALALSKLNHPNIETVHDFDTQDGVDFLALELVEGEALEKRVAAGPLPEREVAALGVQLARGLEAAHREGVIHRDLKPANLRLTPDGLLKLLDFGLARMDRGGSESPTVTVLTESATVVGTLGYMAPEQLQGGKVDARTDLFSAGAVLYELATGRRPFEGDTPAQVMYRILNEAPDPARARGQSLSPGLEAILLKALEKDPELRYQSARELRVDLERLTMPRSAPVARPRRRSKAPALAMGLAVVMMLALAAVLGRSGCPNTAKEVMRSLAVLPLANLSGDPAQDFFADGMTEELITTLTKISALTVISRNSVMSFKGSTKPMREIAKALNVGMLLQGSVRRAGERVRITTQLVRAATGQNLWAESYERDLSDVLKLQSDVALAIAREIQVKLTPQEEQRLASAPTVDPRAHELYLRGRVETNRATKEGVFRGIKLFEEALALDPGHGQAYVGLAEAYYFLSNYQMPPDQAMPRVQQYARRALELDPGMASGHVLLALVKLNYEWKSEEAQPEIQKALEVNPGDAVVQMWTGYMRLEQGRFDESENHFRRAAELDPLSPALRWHASFPMFYRGDYEKLIRDLEFRAQVDPGDWMTFSLLGESYEQVRNYDRAIETLRKSWTLGGNTWVLAAIGRVHAEAGRPDSARAAIRELEGLRRSGHVQDYGIATIFGALGEKDRAFELLEKCYRERSEDLMLLKIDPRVAPLRSDPRYADLLRRVGLGS